jgi:ubiquinone/menaquinone biosynthesis C-methylase UbiE
VNEAARFLLDFHRLHPGCTSQAFANGKCLKTGRSSYALLADLANGDDTLDLGCGDGHLLDLLAQSPARATGIDWSAAELARAAHSSHLRRLVRARAQRLPFADQSFSLVLSHLAFHLMSEPEILVAEIGRVLRPSGRFATIVGGGPKVGDPFELFLDLMIQTRQEDQRIPRIGHSSTRTDAGLRLLFAESEAFTAPLQIDEYYVDFGGTFEEVWSRVSTIYDLMHHSADQRSELRACFRKELDASPGMRVPCTMAIRRIIATR